MKDKPETGNWKLELFRLLILNFECLILNIRFQLTGMMVLYFIIFNVFNVHAQQPLSGPEYRVKAGFIYHFTRFTKWPQAAFRDTGNSIILCIASYNPLIDAASSLGNKITKKRKNDIFLSLNNKIIRKRKLKVVKCSNEKETGNCHILFVPSMDKNFTRKILSSIKNRSVLTVGEMEGFIQMGGIINFFKEKKRLQFEVNMDALRRSGLKLSSQLLRSAKNCRME